MDTRVAELIEVAASDGVLTQEDVVYLLGFDECSEEARAMIDSARKIGFKAADGRGYIFAQIGVDALPCPENCVFCSFAACNSTREHRDAIVPTEQIVAHAQVFADAGVDLISLMATAALPFERYLEIIEAVRATIGIASPLMANVGDLSAEEASTLAERGVECAYHALRLGEGRLTAIAPEQRLQTLDHIKEAGLKLMCGVEPLWENAPLDDLSRLIMLQRELRPFATGACPLTISEGMALESGEVPASRERVRQVAAITRLVCGTTVPIGGVGGVAWVDAGTDPRNRGYGSSPEHLKGQVAKKRELLRRDGWRIG